MAFQSRLFLYIFFAILMVPACTMPLDSEEGMSVSLENLESLRVERENWCTPYDRNEYNSGRVVEQTIVDRQGGAFSPYDGTCFNSLRESDIEHIVAISEAHSSGMCGRSRDDKKDFAADYLNLTLATPGLNRNQKIAYDFAEWKPPQNGCWYAWRIVEVKKKYDLSVDRAEKDALRQFLMSCKDVKMQVPSCN